MACGGSPRAQVESPSELKVEEAGLPFYILRADDGREIAPADFFDELKNAQAICVGESHDNPHHHWAQLEIVKVIAEDGSAFGIGMEMFQRPFQGVLDDFTEGKIDEATLLSRTDWKRRWTYDWEFYAPMARVTAAHGGSIRALNISKELKDAWKKEGLEGLPPADRAKIPELDLDDEQHRTWFRSLMESMSEKHGTDAKGDSGTDAEAGGHALYDGGPEGTEHSEAPVAEPAEPGGHPAAHAAGSEEQSEAAEEPAGDFIDQIYPVQVLWDETMADTAAKWLLAQADRRLVIIAGHGHCHESAIIRRMRRRGITSVISVRPVVDTGKGEVADLLSAPVHSFLLVMEKKAK